MIWHVVRFDLGGLEEPVRADLEQMLSGLADLDVVAFLRTGRDVQDPAITGLLVGLADEAALAAYRDHPGHQPVVQRIRELDVPRVAVDIRSDDDPGLLS
ncbi:MAG: Dabb family protein [Nitriliruptor sp.]|uniref:Dabb family protein n=1 Tax=Nitriliruptor sp. TaxID=2448056 RepID=UPI0034A02DE7